MIFDGRNHLTTVRDGDGARREFATQAEADAAAQAELQSWAPFLLLDKRNRLVGGFDSEDLAIEAARSRVKREGDQYIIYARDAARLFPEVTALIKQRAWQPTGLKVMEGRLDDVFRELTQGAETVRKAS